MFNRFRKGFILLTAAALISTSVYPASAMAGEVAVQTESETQQTETEAETENLQTEAEETEAVQTETETEQAGTETETEITETEAAETETGTQSETQQANDDPEADRNYRDDAREGFDIQTFSEQEQKEIKAYGIDVSEFNGTIDWNKVKNAGVDFAIIRIGYRGYGTGRIVIDSQALNNLAGAQKAGVKIGAYFFSTAINEEEAVEEAEYVMDILDDYNVTYPIVYDCEGFDNPDYRTYGLSKTARTDNAIAFLNRVEQGGYDAMMYASKSGYENENNWETSRLESLFDMWVAHYPYYTDWGVEYPSYDAVKGTITSYAGEFRMWQFTSQGKIDGISTNVDLDLEYYSEEDQENTQGTEKCINGSWYYFYSDGTMATGWTKHHGNEYYYDSEGRMVHGIYTIDGVTYGFDDVTGVKIYGEKYIAGAWRYFDEETGEMATGWTEHVREYYYDENGCMLYGIQTIDGVMYGFDEVTGVKIYGEKYIEGAWRYFQEDAGVMATGWTRHHGHEYYYDKNGRMLYGIQTIDGVTYGFDEVTGVKIYGEKYTVGGWRYFDEDTGEMATGWTKHHNHEYYYGTDGKMNYGIRTIDGVTYGFDEVTGVKIYGEKYTSGSWRYFDEDTGEMATGWTKHHGNTYYYDENGRMVYGTYKIDGKTYYFDTRTGVLKA